MTGIISISPGLGIKLFLGSSAVIRNSIAVPLKVYVFLRYGKGVACCDKKLLAHNVYSGYDLRDRVLHLDSGVDLEKTIVVVLVEQKFDCPGA